MSTLAARKLLVACTLLFCASSLVAIHSSFLLEMCVKGFRTELVSSENQDWLVDLEPEKGRLDERERSAVHFDETIAGLAVSHLIFQSVSRMSLYSFCEATYRRGGLLLAEAVETVSYVLSSR